MSSLAQLLQQHHAAHPAMELQDAVKFIHQHHCGPGHLVDLQGDVLAHLEQELDRTCADPAAPLFEPLGNGLCRLSLAACKARELKPLTLAHIFALTANDHIPDPQGLDRDLDLICQLGFDPAQTQTYLADYRARGCPMVSHSDAYRQAYHPAYRVVCEYYARILPALCAIDRARSPHSQLLVALDGPCASGKTTLGDALSRIYRCPLIHMDDFFLRPEQRTPQRLSQPGGNVDYERFAQEVLTPLTQGREAHYRPWQCHSGSFGPELTVSPSPVVVVEGCYCLRHDLRDAFPLRIWVSARWSSRRQRLLDRGGPDCLARFEQQWIPLEDAYFRAQGIQDCCHISLDLS